MSIIIYWLITIIFILKNYNTYRQRCVIIYAIEEYQVQKLCLGEKIEVNFDDMENYLKTLFRVFDWGYENILSKKEYKNIQKYIIKK